jgi:hypothetical protein
MQSTSENQIVSDLPHTSLQGLMTQVTMNLEASLLSSVDEEATKQEKSRSRFIADILRAYFAPKEPLTNEAVLLTKDIENLKTLMAMRETEINDLKELNGRLWLSYTECNEKLTRFLLPAPRRSFWNWVRRK